MCLMYSKMSFSVSWRRDSLRFWKISELFDFTFSIFFHCVFVAVEEYIVKICVKLNYQFFSCAKIKMNRGDSQKRRQLNPFLNASILSKLTFWWVLQNSTRIVWNALIDRIFCTNQVAEANVFDWFEACDPRGWHLCGEKWHAKRFEHRSVCKIVGNGVQEEESEFIPNFNENVPSEGVHHWIFVGNSPNCCEVNQATRKNV